MSVTRTEESRGRTVVRRATVDDAGGIASVHVRSWQAAYVGQVPDDYLAGLVASEREPMWRASLSSFRWPGEGCFAAVGDDQVVGFASFGPSRDTDGAGVGELYAIYSLADWWDRGVGRSLLGAVVAQLGSAGYRVATLWVLDTNARAQRFYEAGGWKWDGADKVDDARGFTLRELRYRRLLDADS